jgi:RNA polymerase sigma-54 factor
MRLEPSLRQRQEQRLALLPGMLQSIEVLQLGLHELAERIEAELAGNETLAALPAADAPPDRPAAERGERDQDEPGRARSGGDEDPKLAMLAQIPGREEPLLDSIRAQLAWAEVDQRLGNAVLALASLLDERGLLTLADEQLLELVGAELLQPALALLHELEPRGLGARTPVEAMLLQVDAADPDRPWIEALLTRHLEALARNKLPDVARALGCSLDELDALLERIRRLDPRPGARFTATLERAIRPDVAAWIHDGRLELRVDDHDLPALGIDPEYASLARDRSVEREVRSYLREKIDSARRLIQAVEQRRATLARVAAVVLRRQQRFLEQGVAAIAPLKMAEVAGELGLHVSTVSRAIAGKYVQTPHGIFRLREIFDGGESAASDASGGSAPAGRAGVKEIIRQIVLAEKREQPLSDDELVAALLQRGVQVARRTVAKYRQELGIPSSWLRRRHEPKG